MKNNFIMKANLLLLLFVGIFVHASFAQKLKDKRIGFSYVKLPSDRLPEDFMTYSVSVYGRNIPDGGFSANGLAKGIKMNSFKRLDGSPGNHGHLRVSVQTGYTTAGSPDFKSRTDTKKDKEGNETKTTYYWYEFPFSSSGSYKIVDPTGKNLASGNTGSSRTMKTSETTNSAALRKAYSKHKSEQRKAFARSAANNSVTKASNALIGKYDFHHDKVWHQIYWIKKHSTETNFVKYFDLTKKVFAAAKAGTPASELKTQMQAALDFWQEIAAKDPGGDKKMKRVYKAANHNLAVVSYYLDDLAGAKKYAEAVIKSEGKDKRSAAMISKINATQKLMAFHEINTVHYTRDLSNAIAPSKVQELEEIKEEIATNNNTIEGTIIVEGEVLKGSIIQEKEAKDIFFGEDGNTKFVVEMDNDIKEFNLAHEDVASFKIGDRSFVKMNFTPSAKGKTETKKHILEEVYISDKINLYQYFPSTGKLGDEKTEFAFQKKGAEQPTSLMATQFLILKKGLANYFSDCADLKDMCSTGDIKMDKDDLIKAARIYSELCE